MKKSKTTLVSRTNKPKIGELSSFKASAVLASCYLDVYSRKTPMQSSGTAFTTHVFTPMRSSHNNVKNEKWNRFIGTNKAKVRLLLVLGGALSRLGLVRLTANKRVGLASIQKRGTSNLSNYSSRLCISHWTKHLLPNLKRPGQQSGTGNVERLLAFGITGLFSVNTFVYRNYCVHGGKNDWTCWSCSANDSGNIVHMGPDSAWCRPGIRLQQRAGEKWQDGTV